MHHLLPGVHKFAERVFPKQQKLFESLSGGQKPHTLFITCSDSRIDPNLVLQTKPGEVFIIRNAGNIIPPFGRSSGGEEAAIEFAIEGLGVNNIVICGHSQCGAMAGLNDLNSLETLPALKRWLKYATATKMRCSALGCENDINRVTEENVLVQADHLKTYPAVSTALRLGRIQIYGWVYRFETGEMEVYCPNEKKYLRSTDLPPVDPNQPSPYAL